MEKKRRESKEKLRLKDILILQAVIVIYTLSSVMAKLASGQEAFSAPFLLFYLAELMILGVYAILWQQMIKKFELSVAYTNRAMALLWSMLWAVVLFHDRVTMKNVIGGLRGLSFLNVPVIESFGYVFVLFLSRLFFGERITKRKLAGVGCILAGMLIYYL